MNEIISLLRSLQFPILCICIIIFAQYIFTEYTCHKIVLSYIIVFGLVIHKSICILICSNTLQR